jgi:uncharacterized protein YndB with AHSA1/START domain
MSEKSVKIVKTKAGEKATEGAGAERAAAAEQGKAVFRVVIEGTIDQVWRELTKTDEVQQAMFNSRLHTPGLRPGSPICMRSPNGRYTSVVGNVIELERPVRYSHTFRFTSYDDPPCSIVYDLREVEGGVEFTLTILDLPVGTKTAKQMMSGGKMIVGTMKSVIETGRPSLGVRLLYVLFKAMEPMSPASAKSERWPFEAVKVQARS